MTEKSKIESTLVENFLADSSNSQVKKDLNLEYWKSVDQLVREKCAGGKAENLTFTWEEKLRIDFGYLSSELIDEEKVDLQKLRSAYTIQPQNEAAFLFTEWLDKQYAIILKKPEKQKLKVAVEACDNALSKLQSNVYDLQLKREKLFAESYRDQLTEDNSFSLKLYNKRVNEFSRYKNIDSDYKKIETKKRSVENGLFMTPDEKRDFIRLQLEFDRQKYRVEEIVSEIKGAGLIEKLEGLTSQIKEIIIEISRLERRRNAAGQKLTDLIKKVEAISAVEIENSLSKVVGFHKDMVKLCANRKRMEALSVLHGDKKPFALEEISEYVKYVTEFDPKLFKNDRININGIPSILIVPGTGNGMYDWKYNTLLIPTMPPGEKLNSVVGALVEYRLDCDEDKLLMLSYHKLKSYAGVRSGFTLKSKFYKDYLTFIKQETKGYKVLPKEIRNWFDRIIAPKKREIKIPLKVDPIILSKKEYEDLKDETDRKISENVADAQDYFIKGTIHQFMGEDRYALNAFMRSLKLESNNLTCLFNTGVMAMKLKEKELAVKLFSNYVKQEPQSWWSNVCKEHIIELQK